VILKALQIQLYFFAYVFIIKCAIATDQEVREN